MIRKLHIENILQILFTIHCCQPILIPLHIVICLFSVYTFYELACSTSYISSQYTGYCWLTLTELLTFIFVLQVKTIAYLFQGDVEANNKQGSKVNHSRWSFQPTRCKAVPGSTSLCPVASGARVKMCYRPGGCCTGWPCHIWWHLGSMSPVPQ